MDLAVDVVGGVFDLADDVVEIACVTDSQGRVGADGEVAVGVEADFDLVEGVVLFEEVTSELGGDGHGALRGHSDKDDHVAVLIAAEGEDDLDVREVLADEVDDENTG